MVLTPKLQATADIGQPSVWWEIFSLCIRGSLSVMAATNPAMSAEKVAWFAAAAMQKLSWQRAAIHDQR